MKQLLAGDRKYIAQRLKPLVDLNIESDGGGNKSIYA